jgi:hypothetical protein
MANNTLIYVGGAAVLGYVLIKNSAVSSPSTAGTVQGAPPAPATYNQAYYLAYQYPALIAANPNLLNPNYQLSATDAGNYLANYTDIQQWANTVVPKPFGTLQQALQYHWTTYGVPDKRSFVPFAPPDNANWVPPPAQPKSSGSSSTFSSILGTVASVGIAVLGVTDNTRLNDADLQLLYTGGGVAKDIAAMYHNVNPDLSWAVYAKINEILTNYL